VTERIYNFSSGPAVLPLPVLEQAQRDLIALPGVGMSVMEVSHRSSTFEGIIGKAEADMRRLAGIPDDYRILFLQGGATLQFSMVPLNLLTEGRTADYIMTGTWADKAVKEARRVGSVNETGSTADTNFNRIPTDAELTFTPGAAYVHMTSNNTIEGTEWHRLPPVGDVPLVSDASSDIFSRPIDVSRFGLIYAGAQKNLGPSGVTVVIIREDLLERSGKALHTMLNYAVHAENGSLYNTPPAFGVYVLGLVIEWLLGQGGLPAIAAVNERKAGKLYAELDRSDPPDRDDEGAASRVDPDLPFRPGPADVIVDRSRPRGDVRRRHRPPGPRVVALLDAVRPAQVVARGDEQR